MDARMERERKETRRPPSRCAISVPRTRQVPGLPAGASAHIANRLDPAPPMHLLIKQTVPLTSKQKKSGFHFVAV